MAARADTPEPNDRLNRTDDDRVVEGEIVEAEIVDDRNDRVDTGRPIEREVVVERTDRDGDGVPDGAEHPVVADNDTLDRGQHVDPNAVIVPDRAVREEVVAREKARFGGMKFGSAFFGWLTAAGTAVILTTLVTAVGTGIGLGLMDGEDVDSSEAQTIGIAGVIALAAIIFVAYLAGGYVAGRMARFSGAKQGVAVWLWAVIIAIVAAIVGFIWGAQFDVLERLNALPRLPLYEGDVTVTGIITAILVLLIALAGAVLGGLAGMRYHRRVDRVGLEPERVV